MPYCQLLSLNKMWWGWVVVVGVDENENKGH